MSTSCAKINTAPLNLEEIIKEIKVGIENGASIVRLHSGDLSVWSAMGEQLRMLRLEGIPYTVTPGVPSFAAAAAALETELTLPGVAQSVVLTRTSGRASKMPKGETLRILLKLEQLLLSIYQYKFWRMSLSRSLHILDLNAHVRLFFVQHGQSKKFFEELLIR